MTRDPFTATPAQAARNAHAAKVSAYIELEAVSDAHARRARVRLACLHPPTRALPTLEDVDAVLAATAPPAEEPTA